MLIRAHEQFHLAADGLRLRVEDDARGAGARIGDHLQPVDVGEERRGIEGDAPVGHARLEAKLVVSHLFVVPGRVTAVGHEILGGRTQSDVERIVDAAEPEAFDACAVICTFSVGLNERITRGEKPSDEVDPGWSV